MMTTTRTLLTLSWALCAAGCPSPSPTPADAGLPTIDAGPTTNDAAVDAAPRADEPFLAATETLRRQVTDRLESGDVPSIVVVVQHRGFTRQIILGVRSTATGERTTDTTRFQLASATKPLVAGVAFRMVEDGRLSLDENVAALGPETAVGRDEVTLDVTLGQLLSHSSGLGYPAYIRDIDTLTAEFAGRPPSEARRTVFGRARFPVWYPPGEVYSYQNQGYSLAGHLIELRRGRALEAAVVEDVLRPLGMNEAGYLYEDGYFPDDIADAHVGAPTVVDPIGNWLFTGVGHGGLLASANDLSAWIAALLARPAELFSAETWASYLDESVIGVDDASAPDPSWGYAFEQRVIDGRRVFGHAGGARGAGSIVQVVPDEEFAVAVVTNCDWVFPIEIAFEAMRAYTGMDASVPTMLRPPTDTFLNELVGEYDSVAYGPLSIERSGAATRVTFRDFAGSSDLFFLDEQVAVMRIAPELASHVFGRPIAAPYDVYVTFSRARDGRVFLVSRPGVAFPRET